MSVDLDSKVKATVTAGTAVKVNGIPVELLHDAEVETTLRNINAMLSLGQKPAGPR